MKYMSRTMTLTNMVLVRGNKTVREEDEKVNVNDNDNSV